MSKMQDYYDSGKVKREYEVNNLGLINGLVQTYTEKGLEISTVFYENGLKHGMATENRFLNNVERHLKYEYGKIQGQCRTTDYNKGTETISTYVDDVKNGPEIVKDIFNSKNAFDGNVIEENEYVDGLKDGKCITYFNDERKQVSSIINYEQGIKEGLVEYYNDNNVLIKTENYLNGIKDGLSQEFRENNTIDTIYKNGKIDTVTENSNFIDYVKKDYYVDDMLYISKTFVKDFLRIEEKSLNANVDAKLVIVYDEENKIEQVAVKKAYCENPTIYDNKYFSNEDYSQEQLEKISVLAKNIKDISIIDNINNISIKYIDTMIKNTYANKSPLDNINNKTKKSSRL